jgi:Tol biopolymer transport system component
MQRTGFRTACGAGLLALMLAAGATATQGMARNGLMWRVALTSNREGDSEIYSMNPDGSGARRLTHSPKYDGAGPWSPDGTKMLFYSQRSGGQVWVMNADGSAQRRLTRGSSFNAPGGWSPDGKKIVFTSNRDGNNELYVMNADGCGQRILSPSPSSDEVAGGWSPDGKTIGFATNRDGNWEIYLVNADGSDPRNLTRNPGNDGGIGGAQGAIFSPDGRRILFASARDTRDRDNAELYVMNADGSALRRLTHTPGSEVPLSWSPEGRRIAFQRIPSKPRWAFFVMNADGSGTHEVKWALPGTP